MLGVIGMIVGALAAHRDRLRWFLYGRPDRYSARFSSWMFGPFIDNESVASHASLIADRSPLGGNPRNYTGIKHPLYFFVKP